MQQCEHGTDQRTLKKGSNRKGKGAGKQRANHVQHLTTPFTRGCPCERFTRGCPCLQRSMDLPNSSYFSWASRIFAHFRLYRSEFFP